MVARDRRLLYPENVNREDIAQSCLDQAGWAAKLGSPMYEALLRRMAEDVRAGSKPKASTLQVRGFRLQPEDGHYWRAASQCITTVIGAEFSSSALRLTRKRCPSRVTTY
jgi:hypothetical protein